MYVEKERKMPSLLPGSHPSGHSYSSREESFSDDCSTCWESPPAFSVASKVRKPEDRAPRYHLCGVPFPCSSEPMYDKAALTRVSRGGGDRGSDPRSCTWPVPKSHCVPLNIWEVQKVEDDTPEAGFTAGMFVITSVLRVTLQPVTHKTDHKDSPDDTRTQGRRLKYRSLQCMTPARGL